MNRYLTKLITEPELYGAKYTAIGEDSVLKQLWLCDAGANLIDDGRIKTVDAVCDLVFELCLADQRAVFLAGVQVGA